MLIKCHSNYGFHIIRIEQDFEEDTDFENLKNSVTQGLEDGHTKIALSMGINTYPYSKLISVLIQCNNLAKGRGGVLAIIQPNKDFLDVLIRTRLDDILLIVSSEEDLEGKQ